MNNTRKNVVLLALLLAIGILAFAGRRAAQDSTDRRVLNIRPDDLSSKHRAAGLVASNSSAPLESSPESTSSVENAAATLNPYTSEQTMALARKIVGSGSVQDQQRSINFHRERQFNFYLLQAGESVSILEAANVVEQPDGRATDGNTKGSNERHSGGDTFLKNPYEQMILLSQPSSPMSYIENARRSAE